MSEYAQDSAEPDAVTGKARPIGRDSRLSDNYPVDRRSGLLALVVTAAVTGGLRAQSTPMTDGAFSLEQARRGARSVSECARCHGADLEGDLAPPLAGPVHLARWSTRTLAELYERVAANVARDPSAVDADIQSRAADVTAYLLLVNGFRAGTAPLKGSGLARSDRRVGEPARR